MLKQAFDNTYRKYAVLLSLFLILPALGSIIWIISYRSHSTLLYADIYQQGELLQSIPLSTVEKPYTFSIEDVNGNFNIIEIRPGSVGITSANCPDKLCVHQGFIQNSLLPITCLPNRLVIQIREEKPIEPTNTTTDAVTY